MTTQQTDALQCAADLEYSIARHGMQDAFTLNAYRAMKMVRTQHARITELESQLESQLAQRFDAADVATVSAQGFRDGVASLSANAGEPRNATDRDALIDAIAQGLHGTWHCTRVWEAWHVGTMSQDDFEPVDESETPTEIADAVLAMLAAQVGAVESNTADAAPTQGATDMENLQRTAVGWQGRALRAERNWAVCRRWAIAGGAPVEKLGDDPDQPFHAASLAAGQATAAPQGVAYAALPEPYCNAHDDADACYPDMFSEYQMRAFADATHTLRASHGQAPAGAAPECLTCSDHGAVGNILTAEPCPDCTHLNAQPAPATQPAPVLWVSPEQFANFMDSDEAPFGKYVPARKTSAGNFTMPLFAASAPAPAQQAAQQGVAYADAHGAIMGAAYDFRDAHISGSQNQKRSAHAALESAVTHALRASHGQAPADYLAQREIPFVPKNGGAHLIVEGKDCFIDFWPGTGKWHSRCGKKGFGVRNLVAFIETPSNA